MTLRSGYYDKAKPDLRGVIRDDGWGVYECYAHRGDNAHKTPQEARECARAALQHLKAHDELPEGWSLTDQARKVETERGRS